LTRSAYTITAGNTLLGGFLFEGIDEPMLTKKSQILSSEHKPQTAKSIKTTAKNIADDYNSEKRNCQSVDNFA
jgi:hypothetical protein